MKREHIFTILFSIWLLDLISTLIFLSLDSSMYEANPVSRFFFETAGVGTYIILVGFLLYGCAWGLLYLQEFLNKKIFGSGDFMLWCGLGTYLILETFTIINNFYLFFAK